MKADESKRIEFDECVTGITDRKKRNRTIKNKSDKRAICPVINPLTKSKADEPLALAIDSIPESMKSCDIPLSSFLQGVIKYEILMQHNLNNFIIPLLLIT